MSGIGNGSPAAARLLETARAVQADLEVVEFNLGDTRVVGKDGHGWADDVCGEFVRVEGVLDLLAKVWGRRP